MESGNRDGHVEILERDATTHDAIRASLAMRCEYRICQRQFQSP